MGLRRWVRRLEHKAGHLCGVLRLPGGKEVLHSEGEMLDALAASIRRRDHRLLPHVREADTSEGMAGLIRQLEATRPAWRGSKMGLRGRLERLERKAERGAIGK